MSFRNSRKGFSGSRVYFQCIFAGAILAIFFHDIQMVELFSASHLPVFFGEKNQRCDSNKTTSEKTSRRLKPWLWGKLARHTAAKTDPLGATGGSEVSEPNWRLQIRKKITLPTTETGIWSSLHLPQQHPLTNLTTHLWIFHSQSAFHGTQEKNRFMGPVQRCPQMAASRLRPLKPHGCHLHHNITTWLKLKYNFTSRDSTQRLQTPHLFSSLSASALSSHALAKMLTSFISRTHLPSRFPPLPHMFWMYFLKFHFPGAVQWETKMPFPVPTLVADEDSEQLAHPIVLAPEFFEGTIGCTLIVRDFYHRDSHPTIPTIPWIFEFCDFFLYTREKKVTGHGSLQVCQNNLQWRSLDLDQMADLYKLPTDVIHVDPKLNGSLLVSDKRPIPPSTLTVTWTHSDTDANSCGVYATAPQNQDGRHRNHCLKRRGQKKDIANTSTYHLP